MYITRPQASGERVSAGLSPTALTGDRGPYAALYCLHARGALRPTRRSRGAPMSTVCVHDCNILCCTKDGQDANTAHRSQISKYYRAPPPPRPIYIYINDSRLNPAFPGSPARARSRGHAACGPTAEQPRTTTRTVDAHTDRSKMGVVRSTRPPSQRLPQSEHEALPARRRGKPESYSSAFNCCSCVLPWLIAAVAHSCRGS